MNYLCFGAVMWCWFSLQDEVPAGPELTAVSGITGGEFLPALPLEDQHGHPEEIETRNKRLIFSFEKRSGGVMRQFLKDKPGDYLEGHGVVFIAEVSTMPPRMAEKVVMPRIRKFKHRVFIADEPQFAVRFHKKAGLLTLIRLDEKGRVAHIDHTADLSVLTQWVEAP